MSSSSQQNEMPILSGNGGNDNIIVPSTSAPPSQEGQNRPCKKVVRYTECMRNHAAALGNNSTDGCGEFMPSGEDGTPETLKCSACGCHRNFHRKVIECDCFSECYFSLLRNGECHNFVICPRKHHNNGSNPSESDEKNDEAGRSVGRSSDNQGKKRFRTKFTQEQKEKMISFAEKAGWKIQKLDDSVIQQFCQEVGIKRRVLKVWMHNNKHNFAKKKSNT